MMMERRKVQDREEALDLLDELRTTRQSLSTFCHERGLDGRSLQCWKTNLARAGSDEARRELRLVELALPEAAPPSRYRVHLGGAMIEVEDGFQEGTLARLLAVVRSC